ncbi:hypothetical protein A7P95_00875 [Eikenella longinqua]|uniref:Uncharacterized protein n=1 Tax=Eikenella longinqua TaxID=1795827 RepID=A0A1A9S203_9NEIS|nr:hypothetical protein [Eikenella longinqua]OAM31086.1 hypothetical protein A7P95_00875 [Eikenella longinqua]
MKLRIPAALLPAAAAALFWAQPAAAQCNGHTCNGVPTHILHESQQRAIEQARQSQYQRQQREQQALRGPRPMTAEEERALEIVFNGDPKASRGCNPTLQDGRLSCWEYINDPRMGMVFFSHVTPVTDLNDCIRNPRRCHRHGLKYTYGTDGRLYDIEIYDRGILPKGENRYDFLPNGSVEVSDLKRSNDRDNLRNSYTITPDEALRRLGLPRSLLNIGRLTVNTRLLAGKAAQLPAGCPGTAESGSWSAVCNINLLWKNGR